MLSFAKAQKGGLVNRQKRDFEIESPKLIRIGLKTAFRNVVQSAFEGACPCSSRTTPLPVSRSTKEARDERSIQQLHDWS
jgi:hypothetical protein